MKKAYLLFIVLMLTLKTASAEVVWDDEGEILLKPGDKFNIDPYIIQAVDLDREGIVLKLYKYDRIVDTWVLKINDDFIYDDDIKINMSEFFAGANGMARLHLWKRAVPEFVISVQTEKDTYSAGSNIPVTINIKNNGNITAKNIAAVLDPGDFELVTGQMEKTFDSINANTQVSYSVAVAAPGSPKKSSSTLTVKVSGNDEDNRDYTGYGSRSVIISSNILIEKTVEGNKIDNVPYAYWGIPVNVSIRLQNFGSSDIEGLQLSDGITSDFEAVSAPTSILNLPQGEEKIIKYTIIPKKPGKYSLPRANASFILNNERVKLQSEEQELLVGGAYIQLTKGYEIMDEKGLVQVTVTALNTGDIEAKAVISESLPENVKLLDSVSLNRSITLKPGEKEIITYLVSVPQKMDFPPATVRYNNLNLESNKISIVLPEYKPAQISDSKKPGLPVNLDDLPANLDFFSAVTLSALFGWILVSTIKNGKYNLSFTIESMGTKKVISSTLGMVILMLSMLLLIAVAIITTQELIGKKYTIFIIYIFIFSSVIRYVETRKAV